MYRQQASKLRTLPHGRLARGRQHRGQGGTGEEEMSGGSCGARRFAIFGKTRVNAHA
jgi:hypothetical protein